MSRSSIMWHVLPLSAVPLAPVLVAGLTVSVLTSQQGQGPVYSVAAVQGQLARDPGAWNGRTLVVRATARRHCADRTLVLVAAAGPETITVPLVACGQVPSLLGLLRRLPGLGRWVSPPHVLQPGTVGVYRIQLPLVPGYDAVLLDSTPSCGAG